MAFQSGSLNIGRYNMKARWTPELQLEFERLHEIEKMTTKPLDWSLEEWEYYIDGQSTYTTQI
jgi:hypothetical protein